MKKVKAGFTLVEMIIAIMLMAMVGVLLGIIFNTFFRGQGMIDKEAAIQAEMRTAMQTVDNTVGKATAVFVLDDSKYKGSKEGLTKGWSYVGLSADGKKILNHVWNKNKNDWDITELGVKSIYDMKMDLTFKTEGAYQDNRLLKYDLSGQFAKSNNQLSLDTAIMALNTKQIFSKVAKGKKGIAIAYRNDPIEGNFNIAVSFVFDTSGSMAWTMSRKSDGSKSRMNILKEKANLLVDDLAKIGNVRTNLVEFNTLGAYVQESFVDLDTDVNQIRTKINSLKSNGGTNPGDGLRYSLVSMRGNKAQLKYVVLLTDGLPNIYSVGSYKSKTTHSYYVTDYVDPKPDLSDLVGSKAKKEFYWNKSDTQALPEASKYAGQVMSTFGSDIRRVSVIGFSALKNEIAYGQNMTDEIGKSGVAAEYAEATSEAKLQEVFSGIKKQIEQDKWFVAGP
ncbi:VWA domain-containing protein [Streptococcus oricebi]|uniref:Nitric oxide reductase n=1 Tax=Streptococcus oricebi TaxID=1547447 RepID=A0ABS5B830_9STRE|nr:VWA domain-containing protein [Streptococcus oricebi]MBP2624184.1 nitric oxide reductase [Streptococcus oricebi]